MIARVEVTGYEHLPKEGSFVIATNHLGIVDAPIAFYALDRWETDKFHLVLPASAAQDQGRAAAGRSFHGWGTRRSLRGTESLWHPAVVPLAR